MGNRAGAFCSGSVCPKSGPHAVGDHELYDDATMCDPAGAVFQETLEDLNEVDRLLANFASTSNLAAVRWLFILGANFDACDTNGTTCLHAACRSGSPAVVREFIQRELPLDATDTAGWTPLHVALFMGRRSVAVELMQSGADLTTRNLQGHSPADLCSDVWLREAIDACVAHRRAHGPSVPWRCEHETQEDVKVASRLRFEPFFVPRAPVLKDLVGCTDLLELGTEIFNQRPGQGLAFLVATGCVRDFPVELSNFLSENRVSPAMVGEFLGEDFSLSQTLRLEYINSVRVVGTGIVSCLTKVFQKFHLPSDLHKIDRLIDAVAQIWWRQHEQIKDKTVVPDALSGADSGEVEGLSLMKHVGDHDALHQLMLSAVLLHWNLYSPLPPSQRMTPARWIEMNSGIAAGKGSRDDPTRTSMLKHIQCLVYNLISHTFYPQLQIWSSRCPSGIIGPGMIPKTPSSHPSADESGPPAAGAFAHEQGAVDGWASLIGGSFPSLAGSSLTVTYRQIRGILSETTSTTLVTPMTSRSSRAGVEPQQEQHQRHGPQAGVGPDGHSYRHAPSKTPSTVVAQQAVEGGPHGDKVWLSMRHALLFLAPKPQGWAPYALVHLRGAVVEGWDQASLVLTLASLGRGDNYPRTEMASRAASGQQRSGGVVGPGDLPSDFDSPQLQLIFLLPDGRWQVIELPYLQVQLPDLEQLDLWLRGLEVQRNLPLPSNGPRPFGGASQRPPSLECTSPEEATDADSRDI